MNETVLITGASSGIGLELAKCFAADQSNLILVARSTAAMEKLAAELRERFQIEVHVLPAERELQFEISHAVPPQVSPSPPCCGRRESDWIGRRQNISPVPARCRRTRR